jgi:hypothetical protein
MYQSSRAVHSEHHLVPLPGVGKGSRVLSDVILWLIWGWRIIMFVSWARWLWSCDNLLDTAWSSVHCPYQYAHHNLRKTMGGTADVGQTSHGGWDDGQRWLSSGSFLGNCIQNPPAMLCLQTWLRYTLANSGNSSSLSTYMRQCWHWSHAHPGSYRISWV